MAQIKFAVATFLFVSTLFMCTRSIEGRNLKLLRENAIPEQISRYMIFKAEIKKTADQNSNLHGENYHVTQNTNEIGQIAPMEPTAQSQCADKSLPPPSPTHAHDFRPTAPGDFHIGVGHFLQN